MSRVCAITGKGPLTGNRRSHSMRASRRTWNVNLQKVKVMVDGKELKTTDYTVKEGSTIVTLNAAYLETLSVGKHTLEIESKNGIAKTEFTITAAQTGGDDQTGGSDQTGSDTTPQEPDKNGGDTTIPQTGDSSNAVLWIALLFASGVGLMGAAVYSRKKDTANNQ